MKQADINPINGVAFKSDRTITVGNWSFSDGYDAFGNDWTNIRSVYHYDTLMGEFYSTNNEPWKFAPLSVGHGSVSDQQGMNRILKDTGWTYRRNDGKPRYENSNGVQRFPH